MKSLGLIGAPEIIVIVLLVLLLFGGKKIPELMRGLGKGVKEYKKAINSVEEEINNIDKVDDESSAKNNDANTAK